MKVMVADVAHHRLEKDVMNSSMGSQDFEGTIDGGSPTLRGKERKKRSMRKQGTRDHSLEPQSPALGMMTPDGQLIGPDGRVISSKGSNKKKPGSKHSAKGGAAQGQVVV